MSTPKPDDRLLEDYLAGRGPLARAAQDLPKTSAPEALDQSVLALARAEAARPPRRHSYRDARWQWPLALAGSFVIVSALVQPLWDSGSPIPMVEAPAGAPEPTLLDAAVERRAPDKLVPGAQPKVAPAAPRPAPAKNALQPKAAAEKTPVADAAQTEAAETQGDPVALALAPAAEPAADPVAANLPPPIARFAAAEDVPRARAESKAAEAAAAAPPSAPGAAKPLRDSKDWLKEIRDLMRAGQRAEARKRMAEFRLQYPNKAVLPDLQKLEAEPLPK